MKKLMLFVLLPLILIFPCPVFAQNPIWTPYENISDSSNAAGRPDAVVDSYGCLHVIWEQEDGIYHRYLNSGVWSDSQRLSSDGVLAYRPQLATDSRGLVYAVWFEQSSEGALLLTSTWSQGGWGNSMQVVDRPVLGNIALEVACGATSVHFAWVEGKDRNLFVSTSFNNSPILLANNIDGDFSLAATGGQVVVAWLERKDGERYAVVKTYRDEWGGGERINFGSEPRFVMYPKLSFSHNGLYFAVQVGKSEGTELIVYERSSDGWDTFVNKQLGLVFYDYYVTADGILHLLYGSNVAYRGSNVFYLNWDGNWENETNVSRTYWVNSGRPSLVFDRSGVGYAVWQEARGDWGNYRQIVYSSTFCYQPVVFVPGIADNISDWRLGDKAAYVKKLVDYGYPKELIRVYGEEINYNMYGDLGLSAIGLRDVVLELSERHKDWGGDGKVDIVGYSLGGIVARDYVQQFPADHQVRKLVTIASPHRGVWPLTADNFLLLLGDYGLDFGERLQVSANSVLGGLYNKLGFEDIDFRSRAMQQLRPNSPYLADLNSCLDQSVDYAALYGDIDLEITAYLFFYKLKAFRGSIGDGLVLPSSATGISSPELDVYEYSDGPVLEIVLRTERVENACQVYFEVPTGNELFNYNHLRLPLNSQVVNRVVSLLLELDR